ncbi:NAD-dependent deacetylase [Propionibacterium cyclohexanicum]|uniref:NAD-dependent protein deacetylase n=1 Tax=Propionibacterium cyclohexanicum TaxID=64702 RepID=A0A1H9SZG1_9ACTN|nr:NAD-dependent protein deacylase [Propionibacterium cyclohexanicum]SER89753.1 NAD-dependent deacetylase [Propionibacterium cyclohexanicum]
MSTALLQRILSGARNAVFFGGAGVSTPSGIPDFRSATGLYALSSGSSRPPEYMLSRSCWRDHPEDFYDFYRTYLLHPQARPNRAHRALASLEKSGVLSAVVTQNIDGLHQLAGSRTVFELHGSVLRNHCVDCGHRFPLAAVANSTGIPRCSHCQGIIKPDVVLYEEPLEAQVMEAALEAIRAADVLLVGGTSLNVHPAAGLVDHFTGEHLVLINKSATPADRRAQLVIHDSIDTVLGDAVDSVQGVTS